MRTVDIFCLDIFCLSGLRILSLYDKIQNKVPNNKEADNLAMFYTDSAERFYFILLYENRFPAKKIS